jgi:beta-lactamase regulating signal transducer with metallopeptidase domain
VDTLLDIGLRNALGATVVAAVAAGLGRVCRQPAVRHGLWLLVLLKLVAPPLLPVRLPPPPRSETPALPGGPSPAPNPDTLPRAEEGPAEVPEPLPPARLSTPAAEPAPPAPPRLPGWKPAVLSLWLIGSALWWVLAGVRLARFGRLLRHARPAPAAVHEQATRLAARLGLTRCPGVWFVPAPLSPMLWALAGRPRLLLPAALWDRLGAEQQDTLLAHELAHLRRGDHWVRRLELLVLGLYWWHPVAWWARRQLREAEEQCCDAWVVWALPAAARAYATALLETVTFLSQTRPALPAAASGAGHVQLLKRRLTMILRGTSPRTLTWGGLLPVAGVAALLLPLWPTWAEPPRPAGTDPARAAGLDAPAVADEEPADAPRPGNKRKPVEEEEEGPPKPKGPPARPGEPGSQVQDLQDEIELLEARLDLKKAELVAAEKALQGAVARLDRIKKLTATGAVSIGELTRAQDEVDTLEAQLLVTKAALREPELRLKQARRRLEKIQGRAEETPAAPRREEARQADAQKRLRELEKKLDDLLKEMDALKKQLGPPKPGGRGAADRDGGTIRVRARRFQMPVNLDAARAADVRELRLYVSTDEGKSWQQVASVPPEARGFDFNAPEDGVYWFTVSTLGRDGKETPPVGANMTPSVKVVVDTTDPP